MDQPRLEHLEEIEAATWRELALAAHTRGHPWRVAVLATRDGEGVDARSVVLREVDAAARELLIFTDARSPKAHQVQAQPEGMLVMWSEALGWQLRLRLALGLLSEGLAVSSRWARLKLTPAAHDYLSPLPPGSTIDAPLPAANPPRESRDHFAVIAARVLRIDWLELDARGHRRAVFDESGSRWVTP
jgi:hypothetical protein